MARGGNRSRRSTPSTPTSPSGTPRTSRTAPTTPPPNLAPPPPSPAPAPAGMPDAELERLMEGISDERLARALGPRLDLLFAQRLDDILMPRLKILTTAYLDTIEFAPLLVGERHHLDTVQERRGLESTRTEKIDMAVALQSSILQVNAIESITDVSNEALTTFGVASAAAQTLQVEQPAPYTSKEYTLRCF